MFLLRLLLLISIPSTVFATSEPSLYEFGAGAGAVWFPHYPGADQTKLLALPFPYFVYRGDILKSDREGGTRASLFRGMTYEVNVTFDGALPVPSSENSARDGMADLGWLGEIGPKLRVRLFRNENSGARLEFPVRAAFMTANFTTYDWHGTVFEPVLIYERFGFPFESLRSTVSFSSFFATEGFTTLFYHVPSANVRPGRAFYNARSGYVSSSLTFMLHWEDESRRNRVITAFGVDSLSGAANSDSPLMRSALNTSVGLAFIHVFHRSDAKVSAGR